MAAGGSSVFAYVARIIVAGAQAAGQATCQAAATIIATTPPPPRTPLYASPARVRSITTGTAHIAAPASTVAKINAAPVTPGRWIAADDD